MTDLAIGFMCGAAATVATFILVPSTLLLALSCIVFFSSDKEP